MLGVIYRWSSQQIINVGNALTYKMATTTDLDTFAPIICMYSGVVTDF